MDEIIKAKISPCSCKPMIEYTCEITNEMNEYNQWPLEYGGGAYFLDPEPAGGKYNPLEYFVPFRVPGATRGHILVCKTFQEQNNSIYEIEEFHFYEDTSFGKIGCFDRDVVAAMDKYLGKGLLFPN